MITARRLTRLYGAHRAVDSIDLDISPGRVVGILGPNGAGKTSTIRMIAGVLPPSDGILTVGGKDARRQPMELRRSVGYLPESTPLYGDMRVGEFLAYRAVLQGVPPSQRRTRIDAALQSADVAAMRGRLIRHLSKGTRQRVGLAAAIVHDPAIVILDEPTVGLDPAQIRGIRALVRTLAGRHTILFSTHILAEAELVCDEVIVMHRGRIRAQGQLAELRRRSRSARPVLIETDLPSAERLLREVPGVERIDALPSDDPWQHLRVCGARPEALLEFVQGRSSRVRSLHVEEPSLESLFIELVEGEEALA